MTPIIFINSKSAPFVRWIMDGKKTFETRTRNTLKNLIGIRVMIAETGHGKPVVRCSAVVSEIIEVFTREAWDKYVRSACILAGSEYDWKPGTKKKVLYQLSDVRPVAPFIPPENRRHGRVWMEYNGNA